MSTIGYIMSTDGSPYYVQVDNVSTVTSGYITFKINRDRYPGTGVDLFTSNETKPYSFVNKYEGGWWTTNASTYFTWGEAEPTPTPTPTPQDRLRRLLRERSAPAVLVGSRSFLPRTEDERELRARDTLRSFIGEDRWRRFLKDGFVSVHSPSDQRTYQVFPGTSGDNITRVYRRGVMEERLCCYLKGGFPPTDHLLMRFLLILNSPGEFRKMCHVHGALRAPESPTLAETKCLVEEFRKLKAVA